MFWGYPYFWKHPYTHTSSWILPQWVPLNDGEKSHRTCFFRLQVFPRINLGHFNSSTETPAIHNKQTMGTHNLHSYRDTTHIFWGCKSVKPSFFMVLGSKGNMCIQKTHQKPTKIKYELRRAVAFEICGCHLTGAGRKMEDVNQNMTTKLGDLLVLQQGSLKWFNLNIVPI